MKAKLVFEDGSEGNYIFNKYLNKDTRLSIINNDGKFNVCEIYHRNGDIIMGDKLFEKDYEKIEIVPVRESYSESDWEGTYTNPPHDGFKCTLPNGKFEVYYFYSSESSLEKLFSEQDDIVDYKQVFLFYGQFYEDVYYVVTHSDKTFSLVHKNLLGLKNKNKLTYIASHAKDISYNSYKNKENNILSIVQEPHESGTISYSYNLKTGKKSAKKYKKFEVESFEAEQNKRQIDDPEFFGDFNKIEEIQSDENILKVSQSGDDDAGGQPSGDIIGDEYIPF